MTLTVRYQPTGWVPGAIPASLAGVAPGASLDSGSIRRRRGLVGASAGSSADSGVATAGEPSGSHPNEPSGFTMIAERSFSALDEGIWNDSDGSNSNPQTLSIIADGTAPVSPSGAMRVTYPAGFTAGGSSSRTVHSSCNLSGNPMDLYWAVAVKPSENFEGHGSSVNKVFYIYESGGGGSAHPYVEFRGGGSNPLMLAVTSQDAGFSQVGYRYNGGANEVSPTQQQAEITRGDWHLVEIRLVCNTASNADGEVHGWLNGVKILQYTGLEFAWGNGWSQLDLHPIWGGIADGSSAAEMSMDFDHLYISSGS